MVKKGIALLLLLLAPRVADACSCAMPGAPDVELASADAVFAGKVTAVEKGSDSPPSDLWRGLRKLLGLRARDDYGRDIHFDVTESWKGVTTTTATVRTGFGGGDCGIDFAKGAVYIVYAYGADGLSTGICTRTIDYANGVEDLAFLASQPRLTLTPVPRSYLIPFLALGAAFVAAAIVWLAKRRRRAT